MTLNKLTTHVILYALLTKRQVQMAQYWPMSSVLALNGRYEPRRSQSQ